MAVHAMIEPYHSRPETRLYRAPELIDLTSKKFDPPKGVYCTKAADIYSVGLIAWVTRVKQTAAALPARLTRTPTIEPWIVAIVRATGGISLI